MGLEMKFVGDFSGIHDIGRILLAGKDKKRHPNIYSCSAFIEAPDDSQAAGKPLIRKDKKKDILKFILVQPSFKSQPLRHILNCLSQLQGYIHL